MSQIMKTDAPEAGVFQDGQEVTMVEVLGLQNSSSFGRKDKVAGDTLLALEISLQQTLFPELEQRRPQLSGHIHKARLSVFGRSQATIHPVMLN